METTTRKVLLSAIWVATIPFVALPEVYEVYEIRPGDKTTLSPTDEHLLVRKLILGESSTLVVSPQGSSFLIVAQETFAGRGSSIVAKGSNGRTASEEGRDGGHGADGTNLRIFFGKLASDGLQVVTGGGSGGDGATGARGQRGSDASCVGSGAGDGHAGKRGGNGGNGGNAGSLQVAVSPRSTGLNFSLSAEGGIGGNRGSGGLGGPGGRGVNRCGPWPYWSRGGGRSGSRGPSGNPGDDGDSRKDRMCIIQDGSDAQMAINRVYERTHKPEDIEFLGRQWNC